MSGGAGSTAGALTAALALLISLGTVNAFIATTSRLGYALARDGVFPAKLSKVDKNGVPLAAVLGVGGFAGVVLVVTYLAGWGPESLLVVPDSLVIVTYVIGMAAGVRLLTGIYRVLAVFSALLCLVLLPFSGVDVVIPVVVAVLAIAYRWWRGRAPAPTTPPGAEPVALGAAGEAGKDEPR
jgi:amino acid efflux transporter